MYIYIKNKTRQRRGEEVLQGYQHDIDEGKPGRNNHTKHGMGRQKHEQTQAFSGWQKLEQGRASLSGSSRYTFVCELMKLFVHV